MIIDYIELEGECLFLIMDPNNTGNDVYYLFTYERLVNGRNKQSVDDPTAEDISLWDGCIVVKTTYYSNTIPYYFDQ